MSQSFSAIDCPLDMLGYASCEIDVFLFDMAMAMAHATTRIV